MLYAGRVDDVINVSGHRIGTAEVEGALTQHPQCAEAAVVPMEHPIKGQGIYAYITLMVVSLWPAHLAYHALMSITPFRFASSFYHQDTHLVSGRHRSSHAPHQGSAPYMYMSPPWLGVAGLFY